MHFPDAIRVYQNAPVNANKTVGIQVLFQGADGFPHQMRFLAGMQKHVIVVAFDPVNPVTGKENNGLIGFNCNSPQVRIFFLQVLQDGKRLLGRFGVVFSSNLFFHFLNGRLKSLARERLEQIIHGVGIKRLDRIFVVSSHKNDGARSLGSGEAFQHRKAIEQGHLDVEKNQVRFMTAGAGESIGAVFTLSNDFDFRIGLQKMANLFPGRRFVINNQSSQSQTARSDR